MNASIENLRACCTYLKLPSKGKRETLCTLIEDELEDLTAIQLKSCLKIFGRDVQGLKQDLYQRLAAIVQKPNSAKREAEENEKLIECPICLETMSPPIYQCHTGHLLCQECYPKLVRCPTCRAALDQNNPIRSRVSEALSATVTVSCPFDGCGHTTTADKINKHKGSCTCRPLACPECDEECDNPLELAEHFETEHEEELQVLETRDSSVTFTSTTTTAPGDNWTYFIETSAGEYVFFRMRIDRERRLQV
eukprot:TRINITY_DN66845_c4_g7_i1.p1 TRINITY_DN66845_c4_g7~~TRINITY_DN66845_c4_g7_i1.p1  ORF type:complete len:251 (-),score=1.69 TRINITY_DN66845_c4_g7_i1:243-995(-)